MVEKFASVLRELASPNSVHGAVLFGSYARALVQRGQAADYLSDLDVQFVVDRPVKFESQLWMPNSLRRNCKSYSVRSVPGGGRKAAIQFPELDVEIVVVGVMKMRIARLLLSVPNMRSCSLLRSRLVPLSDIMRYEHVVFKGDLEWARFYRSSACIGGRSSLSNCDARRMVECAVVDGRNAVAKLARGELYAGMRVYRNVILETNFRLLNEIRERAGVPALHRGRRLEAYLDEVEISWLESNVQNGCQMIALEVEKKMREMLTLYSRLLGEDGYTDGSSRTI